MDSKEDPLYELRPPNSDEITYLTYIQESVGKDRLPVLHDILQDQHLTDSSPARVGGVSDGCRATRQL
jgi:hypothetical protein